METYQIIAIIGFIICVLLLIVGAYDIRYKGECVLHDWEYKYEWGDYFKFTGTFLEKNSRYVCRKCKKTVKK